MRHRKTNATAPVLDSTPLFAEISASMSVIGMFHKNRDAGAERKWAAALRATPQFFARDEPILVLFPHIKWEGSHETETLRFLKGAQATTSLQS
jgi:hypothetical protein